MKKITLLILCIIILSGCSLQNQTNNTNEISQAEKEFNASGQAKAILDESDMLTPAQKIQGKWISLDDEKYIVEFKDNEKIDYYNNEITDKGIFQVTEDNQLIVQDSVGITNYTILENNANNLNLSHLPQGNTLKFERVN